MPEDADGEDGWSIHVPVAGFQTAEVQNEGEPDPLLPSARQVRLVIRDAEDHATGDAA
jgi:hypothetical protein